MTGIAFTLGFFGSLHCIGMCGPLALGVAKYGNNNVVSSFFQAIQYNIGRIITYALLGAIFGMIGETIVITGFQRSFSVFAGVVLLILFVLSMDIEKLLFKFPFYTKVFASFSSYISSSFRSGILKYPILVGFMNGLLPCGLVYLALAGSLTAGGWMLGSVFMLAFGLGTIPAMLGLMILGTGLLGQGRIKSSLANKVFPLLQFLFGVYLIYRGLAVDIPEQLDFWSAIKHPVMCH